MKKSLFAFLLVLAMLLSLGVAAFADDPQYDSTRQYLAFLDENEIIYTFIGQSDSGDDWVEVGWNGENKEAIDVEVFFPASCDFASFYCWNIIDFDESELADVLPVINQLNRDYRFVRFYVDSSDWSVTAQLDAIFRENDVGPICDDAMYYTVQLSDIAYDALKDFAK